MRSFSNANSKVSRTLSLSLAISDYTYTSFGCFILFSFFAVFNKVGILSRCLCAIAMRVKPYISRPVDTNVSCFVYMCIICAWKRSRVRKGWVYGNDVVWPQYRPNHMAFVYMFQPVPYVKLYISICNAHEQRSHGYCHSNWRQCGTSHIINIEHDAFFMFSCPEWHFNWRLLR